MTSVWLTGGSYEETASDIIPSCNNTVRMIKITIQEVARVCRCRGQEEVRYIRFVENKRLIDYTAREQTCLLERAEWFPSAYISGNRIIKVIRLNRCPSDKVALNEPSVQPRSGMNSLLLLNPC